MPEVRDRLSVHGSPPSEAEALIEEARRHQRNRRAKMVAIVFVAFAAVGLLVIWIASTGHPSNTVRRGSTPGSTTDGTGVSLKIAGPLAVGPDGRLYVADTKASRVLLRLRDGRFRAIAGTGKPGLSGDGVLATKATLSDITGLAVAPNGDLYIAAAGEVKAVNRRGIIRTVAGEGHGNPVTHPIRTDTLATSAQLGSSAAVRRNPDLLSIAFGPRGQLYISTPTQILRLTKNRRLDVVHVDPIASGPWKGQRLGGEIAVGKHGNIYVGTTTGGWSIWRIGRGGQVLKIGVSRGSGGMNSPLQNGPQGGVYAQNGEGIARVTASGLTSTYRFPAKLNGQYFPPVYFAFTKTGTIYADDLTVTEGFEQHQQLVSLRHGHETLLWQSANRLR